MWHSIHLGHQSRIKGSSGMDGSLSLFRLESFIPTGQCALCTPSGSALRGSVSRTRAIEAKHFLLLDFLSLCHIDYFLTV